MKKDYATARFNLLIDLIQEVEQDYAGKPSFWSLTSGRTFEEMDGGHVEVPGIFGASSSSPPKRLL